MKNTYLIKQDVSGNNYLEMTTPDGIISFVPMDEANADYQRYLNPETTPTIEVTND